MILPVVAYGSGILRKVAEEITPEYPGLEKFIADMWDTMYNSNGVGLAAPQVNKSIRIFVMDSIQIFENMESDEEKAEYPGDQDIKQVFINPHIVAHNDDNWAYNEGCLSIPKIREDVQRPREITIEYDDENFVAHTATFTGITARVIQHEYDHLEGKLFIDYISPLKRKLMTGKLRDISNLKVKTDYRMIKGH